MSNTKNTGGPAFPTAMEEHHEGVLHFDMPGMTLRDYFAAKAMERFMDEWMDGVKAGRYNQEIEGDLDDDSVHHIIANDAYTMADAMLIAREQ